MKKLLIIIIVVLSVFVYKYGAFDISQNGTDVEPTTDSLTSHDESFNEDTLVILTAEGKYEIDIISENLESEDDLSKLVARSILVWLYEIFKSTVIPLIAVFASYSLLNKREVKKESNLLFIKLELLIRELRQHKKQILSIDEIFTKAILARKKISISLHGFKNSVYDILKDLENLSDSYMFDHYTTTKDKPYGLIYDKPNRTIQSGLEIESLNDKLKEFEERYDNMPNKDVNSIHKEEIYNNICRLKDEIQVKSKIFSESYSRSVHDDIKSINSKIERNNFLGLANKESFGEAFAYIKSELSQYVNKESFNKIAAGKLFYDLMLNKLDYFSEQDPLFRDSELENHKLYQLWHDYYGYKDELQKIKEISLEFSNNQWSTNKSDLVLLHKKNLYIQVLDYYENNQLLVKLQTELLQDFDTSHIDDLEDHYKNFIKESVEKLMLELSSIESELVRVQKSLEKNC